MPVSGGDAALGNIVTASIGGQQRDMPVGSYLFRVIDIHSGMRKKTEMYVNKSHDQFASRSHRIMDITELILRTQIYKFI